MKILLLGKTGLLGQALLRVFSSRHEVVAPSHERCDITHPGDLEREIHSLQPDLVINATGYTKVDEAETDSENAFFLNAQAVENLCKILAKTNTPLVHFSTDYVFDGTKVGGYVETDQPNPLSVYGASKARGERAVLENLSSYYLIRSAWLFGEGGKNFVDTVIELSHASPGKPIRIVKDQRGCPTYTYDLAQGVLRLLETENYGMYHMANGGNCTWYEFAKEIFHQLGIPREITPITSAELGRPAARPENSILLSTKLQPLRPWKEALAAYLMNKTLIA